MQAVDHQYSGSGDAPQVAAANRHAQASLYTPNRFSAKTKASRK